MGESPIYSCSGHLFTVDPVTKANWIPLSKRSVDVNFFYDSVKKCYRIVSLDEIDNSKKVVLNCILRPKMTFKKTSQKFGQWTDLNTKSIYGIGFSSEAELNRFVEKFKTCVEDLRNGSVNAYSAEEHDGNNNNINNNNNNNGTHSNGDALSGGLSSKPIHQHIKKLESELAAARLQADNFNRNGKYTPNGNGNHIMDEITKTSSHTNQMSLIPDSFPPPPMRPILDQLNSQSPGNSTQGSSIISTSSNETYNNLLILNRRLGSILQEAVELQSELSRMLINMTSVQNAN